MNYFVEFLKFRVRGHKDSGGDEAASDVHTALLGTSLRCRRGKLQIMRVNLCQDFYGSIVIGCAK